MPVVGGGQLLIYNLGHEFENSKLHFNIQLIVAIRVEYFACFK